MAKRKGCPICKKEIESHSLTAAMECVNDLELQSSKVTKDNALAVGRAYANLQGVGQKHADRTKFTMYFGGDPVITHEPELTIFKNILQSVKEKKDEGSEEPVEGNSEISGYSEASTSGE